MAVNGAGRSAMAIGRFLGWVLLAAAFAVLAWELWGAWQTGELTIHAAGKVWYDLDRTSLNGAQAGTQRYLLPALWDPVIVTVLTWPALLVLGVPGALLAFFCRKRGGRRR
jgi:hypothetical protein